MAVRGGRGVLDEKTGIPSSLGRGNWRIDPKGSITGFMQDDVLASGVGTTQLGIGAG